MSRPLLIESSVSAVMPCLNEEASLATCIRKIQDAFRNLGVTGEIIVADNGSTDNSVTIAQELGAKVVHVPERGYGAALIGGIRAAEGQIVVMADADGSYDWSDVGTFVDKIQQGYDLVIGNRFKGGIYPGAMPNLHRYLGNPVLSFIARLVSGAPIGDFHCGMRAITKGGFDKLCLTTSGMEMATEMIMNATRNGLRVAEVPTVLYPDMRNRPPHLRSFRDGWRHLRFILTYAPDFLYIAPAVLFLVPGLLLLFLLAEGPRQLGDVYFGTHFLALGMLLTLLGCNTLLFGAQAKLIIARRHPLLQSRMVTWAQSRHTLELSLVGGVFLVLTGLTLDSFILLRWFRQPDLAMDSTIHPAMAATTLIALGVNIMFSAFMLHLIDSETRRARSRSSAGSSGSSEL